MLKMNGPFASRMMCTVPLPYSPPCWNHIEYFFNYQKCVFILSMEQIINPQHRAHFLYTHLYSTVCNEESFPGAINQKVWNVRPRRLKLNCIKRCTREIEIYKVLIPGLTTPWAADKWEIYRRSMVPEQSILNRIGRQVKRSVQVCTAIILF